MRLRSICAAPLLLALAAPAGAATLVNGSMTGALNNGSPPPGWVRLAGTPDTSDASASGNWGGIQTYGVAVTDSPDGGTWAGIVRSGSLNEIFGQTISDFVIGETYTLTWWEGLFGLGSGSYSQDNQVGLFLDGAQVGAGAVLTLDPAWGFASASFTATATEHEISFGLLDGGAQSSVSIDGVAFAASEVPVPAAAPLLIAGLAGMAALRRRSARG